MTGLFVVKEIARPAEFVNSFFCSIILSAVMMLEYFDWKEAAALIEKALEQSFLDARATHDLARFMPNGTSLSTSAFTREIVERIEKQK